MVLNKINTLFTKYSRFIVPSMILFFILNTFYEGSMRILYFWGGYSRDIIGFRHIIDYYIRNLELTANISTVILGIMFLAKYVELKINEKILNYEI